MRKNPFFNQISPKAKVLVAPLDWGLGHATRCIPIIKELISKEYTVLIAADKKIYYLLKKEFPNTVFLPCKGYEISYSHSKFLFPFFLLLQLPKVILSILKERKWLKKMIKIHSIDAVISDNRFGMFSKRIPCYYITHQLSMKTGNRFTEKIAGKIHSYFIKKYTACWVPDWEKEGLAGKLSHPQKVPENVCYIGPLSRFRPFPNVQKIYDLLVTLSGPEPQRTILEKKIFSQLKKFNGKTLVVRGLPSENKKIFSIKDSVTVVNHLSAEELNLAMEQAEMIICRSGYTSIMDLVSLRKKAILIPTPGQTEQEYLAKYLSEKGIFFTEYQKDFLIEDALEQCKSFPFRQPDFSNE